MCAKGGGDVLRVSKNVSIIVEEPDRCMITPLPLFATFPLRPSSFARVYTKGLKPTPWTMPMICMRRCLVRLSPGVLPGMMPLGVFIMSSQNHIIAKTAIP